MRSGKILKVWIDQRQDENPDLSYLGRYSDQAGPVGRTIDRQERGDMQPNEYRYFVAAMSAAETGNPESVEQDYRRMEAGGRGEWCMIGIIAKAEVQTGRNTVVQTIRSGGLWGIESDSGKDYLADVADEQRIELRAELTAIGFSEGQIDKAVHGITA